MLTFLQKCGVFLTYLPRGILSENGKTIANTKFLNLGISIA